MTSDTSSRRIVIIGSGNVATHLAEAFAGVADVVQIYSPTPSHADRLASKVGAEAVSEIDGITDDADYYIVAVRDEAMPSLVRQLQSHGFNRGIWAHTSGSMPLEALAGIGEAHGVFYPMQTFSRDVPVDMSRVPIFLEASSAHALDRLERLGRMVSPRVFRLDSGARQKLHVAAVFACNFTNHMLALSDDLLRAQGLDLGVMRHLVDATIEKAFSAGPSAGQTGPARRGDTEVIARHAASLADNADAQAIYELVSSSIINRYKQ